MLSKTWRIILLIIALATILWPSILGFETTYWIGLIAVVILLIAEITCDDCCKTCRTRPAPARTVAKKKPARKTAKKKTTRKRR